MGTGGNDMKIIILIFMILSLNARDYSELKKYKKMHPSVVKEQAVYISASAVNKSNKVIVRFKDIATFDFYKFEQKYSVELAFCVADGICAFTNKSTKSIEELLRILQNEESLSSVKIYKKYNMKAY